MLIQGIHGIFFYQWKIHKPAWGFEYGIISLSNYNNSFAAQLALRLVYVEIDHGVAIAILSR